MRREIFTQEHDGSGIWCRPSLREGDHPLSRAGGGSRDGVVSRDVWLAAGRAGLLRIRIDEKYGGGGDPDYRYYVILNEELARAGATGPMFQLHNDMIGPYLDRLCTPEQREQSLPGYCSGEIIAAIAMTEPEAGSDLQGMRNSACRAATSYVLNGQKTFICTRTGGCCDIVIVVARTDPAAGHRGIHSLLVVEREIAGFTRRRDLPTSSACTRRTPWAVLHRRPGAGREPARRGRRRLRRTDAEPASRARHDRRHRAGHRRTGLR